MATQATSSQIKQVQAATKAVQALSQQVNAKYPVSGSSGGSSTYSNPKDAPGYVAGSSPTDSAASRAAYAMRTNAPTTPITPVAPAPTTPIDTTIPQTAPNMAQVNAPNAQVTPGAIQATPEQVAAVASATQQVADLQSRYKQGLATAKATTPVPTSQGAAAAGVQANLQTPQIESPSVIGGIIENDSNFDSILTMYDEFMSPQSQKVSLLDEYNKLSGSLGIQAMNAELIDARRIIDGTEDDIRSEITATGGMATDSQVLALANARNKSLIKNYNYLLESRDNATTQLTTMMNLSVQDRQMASAEFDRKMNFAFKVAEFKERATTNARNTYMSLGEKMGWDTLFNGMSSYEQSIAQKTIGITSQQAQQLALKSQKDRTMALEEKNLDLAIKRKTLAGGNEVPTIKTINGVDKQWNPATKQWETPSIDSMGVAGTNLQLAQAQGNIESINNLMSDKNIRSAVGPSMLGRIIGRGWDALTGGRQNFIASVEQIRSNLNLEALIGAKARGATFGALSDQELQVLASSASKIGTWAKKDKGGNVVAYNASEKDFKKELEKINNFAKLDFILKGGDPTSVGIQELNGHYYVQNNDGTITELR